MYGSYLTKLFTAILTASLFSTQGISAEETGRDIMLKVDNRPNGEDRVMEMTMTLINRRDRTRERSMVLYSKDYGKDSKSLFYFEKPADVDGTGFLSWGYDDPEKDDDRWLYLPALKRTKRISGSSRNDSFMGSDLTYDDMGDRSVDEDTHRLIGEEEVDGSMCWIVESTPRDPEDMYSRMVQWIRQDALIGVKGEFFDRKGDLLKTMQKNEIRRHDGFWVSFRMEMVNVQDNHRTILEITSATFDTGLEDDLFRTSTLERGKPR